MSDTDIDSYKQLGNSEPTDSYVAGEGKQRIDLDEYYKETAQEDGTYMVQGFEALSMGKLSKQLARNLKLPNANAYDPFPSERNARAGNEGFFSMVAEKFEEFVTGIIKYIRMVIDWVVDTIKGFFGYRKSTRVTEAVLKHQKDITKEFELTLKGLGFPVQNYNLKNFLQDLPAGDLPKFQLNFMRSKFESEKDSIVGLSASLPLIQQTVAKLKQISDKATNSQKFLKKTISEEYNRVRVRKSTGNFNSASDSTELNRTLKAIEEVKLTIDVKEVSDVIGKIYEELYKVKFTSEELTEGFDKVRAKLKETIVTQRVNLNPQDITFILSGIQDLNVRYLSISDKELDLTGIKWSEIGKIVDKDEASKVKAMSDFYKTPNLLARYQQMGVDVRTFTQFCLSVSTSLMVVEKQANDLITWYNRCHAYYYAGVIGDIETMVNVIENAKAAGYQPLTDKKGRPKPLYFVKEADAEGFMERFSNTARAGLDADINGIRSKINAFSKQLGYGALA